MATCNLSQTAGWAVTIKDGQGAVVRRFSGRGGSLRVVWNGHDGDGRVVADGRYSVMFAASNASGSARLATLAVRVDVGAPRPASLAARPTVVSPNGDGIADRCTLSFVAPKACEARLSVYNKLGTMVRRVADWHNVAAGTTRAVWDGKIGPAGDRRPAPAGPYTFRVELRDAGGHVGSAAGKLAVNDTLGFPEAVPAYFSPNRDGTRDAAELRFTVMRRARVTVAVSRSGKTVRRFSPGSWLPAGARCAGTGSQRVARGSRRVVSPSGCARLTAWALSPSRGRWSSTSTGRC